MLGQPLESNGLPRGAGLAVVAVGVDGNAAPRGEFAPNLDVFGVHEADEILHDDVHAVLVEIPVVAKAEQVQLEGLALHHAGAGHIGYIDGGKIRLAGDGAEAGELRAVELDEIVVVRVLVGEGFQHLGGIVHRIGSFSVPQQGNGAKFLLAALAHTRLLSSSGAAQIRLPRWISPTPQIAGTIWPITRLRARGQ